MIAKEEYSAPIAEVIYFADADVITTSNDDAGHLTSSDEDTRLPRL